MLWAAAVLLLSAVLSAASLDSLDACLETMREEITRLEREEAAVSTILDAVHQRLATSRQYYNELALEEAEIFRQLTGISRVFTSEDSLREALVESLSSYLLYLYSHRNLGGVGSFFVEGGFRRMLRRQAYVDHLASRAADEVLMLSVSQDSLGRYRDSLEVLLLSVQRLRRQMEEVQESIYEEEARHAALRSRIADRISAARESLSVMEERRISRASFVTEISVRASPDRPESMIREPDAAAYIEQGRGSVSWPASGRVVRRFGIETHQQYGTQIMSDGITVATQPSVDVCASAPGVVLYAGEFPGMGRMVILDHQDGYYTVYGYLERLAVRPGETLEPAMPLGVPGALPGGQSGYYFEIRRGGEPVNPEDYLR